MLVYSPDGCRDATNENCDACGNGYHRDSRNRCVANPHPENIFGDQRDSFHNTSLSHDCHDTSGAFHLKPPPFAKWYLIGGGLSYKPPKTLPKNFRLRRASLWLIRKAPFCQMVPNRGGFLMARPFLSGIPLIEFTNSIDSGHCTEKADLDQYPAAFVPEQCGHDQFVSSRQCHDKIGSF